MRHGGDGRGRARRVKESGKPGRIDLAISQNLAPVDAGGDEEPVDAQTQLSSSYLRLSELCGLTDKSDPEVVGQLQYRPSHPDLNDDYGYAGTEV